MQTRNTLNQSACLWVKKSDGLAVLGGFKTEDLEFNQNENNGYEVKQNHFQ